MNEKKILTILLPAYLEAENLTILLPKIRTAVEKLHISYEIIVVDSQNKLDNTSEICHVNNVKHLARLNGDFYGDAIRTGISHSHSDKILIMDADGSHCPEELPLLYYESLKGFDLVIGSRYIKGGYTANNYLLKAMSLLVNSTYRMIFKLKVKDVSNSFRIYDGDKLRKLHLVSDNFDIVEEILIKLTNKNKTLSISEIPISFKNRKYGSSKRNLFIFAISYVISIYKLYQISKD